MLKIPPSAVTLLTKAVDDYLAGRDVPLLPVSDPNLLGYFRKYASYKDIVEDGLAINPSGLSIDALHAKVKPMLADTLQSTLAT